jgi:hypothetical protein
MKKARTGEIRYRHQFNGGDAQRDQIVQPFDGSPKAALWGEGADVQFVQHRFMPGPPDPIAVRPQMLARVDHLRRAMNIGGLTARGRIGNLQAIRQGKAIAAPNPRPISGDNKPAITQRDHR